MNELRIQDIASGRSASTLAEGQELARMTLALRDRWVGIKRLIRPNPAYTILSGDIDRLKQMFPMPRDGRAE